MMDVANDHVEEDFTFLATIDSSSDEEVLSDESDALNVSCHGNHFKRMKEEPKQCNDLTIKRRKLHSQIELMNSTLLSMALRETKEQFISSVPFKKHTFARKMENKRLARKAKG